MIVPLPTTDSLGATPPEPVSANEVADTWLKSFTSAVEKNDIASIRSLFLDDGWWRDFLALTWDFRTFHGGDAIQQLLVDRLSLSQFSVLHLSRNPACQPLLATPYPDLSWIQAAFDFKTLVGSGVAVFRLVYHSSRVWKAFTLVTILENLNCTTPSPDFSPAPIPWADIRNSERDFIDCEPAVLIVGAGQSGLATAARLKKLNTLALVIDKTPRIGDSWRNRYSCLRLHDPLWRDHLPYMPFPEPPFWPIFTPGVKLADWLESYAQNMDLNVWTSSTIKDPKWDPERKQWTLTVVRAGVERVLRPRHIVWATGIDGGRPNMPHFARREIFKGDIIHSTQYHNPAGFEGKKVIVIGAGPSAHDISCDLALHGSNVTMVQRSSTYVMTVKHAIPMMYKELYWSGSPPTETADILSNSFPMWVTKAMSIRLTSRIAEKDKETLEGLKQIGFALNSGIDGSGLYHVSMKRLGGSYIDVGASQLIIDGKIKFKHAAIDSFSEGGVIFSDGTELPADVIICATGVGAVKTIIRDTFGSDMADSLVEAFWDIDAEGEMKGIWRDSGHEGFYVAYGNLPMSRFYSERLALQIKAMEEGLFGTRYSMHK